MLKLLVPILIYINCIGLYVDICALLSRLLRLMPWARACFQEYVPPWPGMHAETAPTPAPRIRCRGSIQCQIQAGPAYFAHAAPIGITIRHPVNSWGKVLEIYTLGGKPLACLGGLQQSCATHPRVCTP